MTARNFEKPSRLCAVIRPVSGFLDDALRATPQVLPRDGTRLVNNNPLYEKSKRVYRLGGVFFNIAHNVAFAYVAEYSTSYDARGSWYGLRKSASGSWERDQTLGGCAWGSAR